MRSLVLTAASNAFNGLFDRKSRTVVLKSLGLTVLLFFGLWFGLERLVSTFVVPFLDGWTWLVAALLWTVTAGVVVTAGFFLAPVTAIFAGLFLDEVAEQVERDRYPEDEPGEAMALGSSIGMALRFGLLVLFANLVALILVWLAGFGVITFFLLNGYLLGREYFQFAAMRLRPRAEAEQVRKKYSAEIFLSGLIIAGFMAIPILNFLTPVFAAKQMVHLHKAITHQG
ncbi:MAG: sulfate transporter family protein [Pseudomonadota bacterium]